MVEGVDCGFGCCEVEAARDEADGIDGVPTHTVNEK